MTRIPSEKNGKIGQLVFGSTPHSRLHTHIHYQHCMHPASCILHAYTRVSPKHMKEKTTRPDTQTNNPSRSQDDDPAASTAGGHRQKKQPNPVVCFAATRFPLYPCPYRTCCVTIHLPILESVRSFDTQSETLACDRQLAVK